ncbi:unnamed protein product [Clonostachys rosea]|uniref:Peptidase S33 tripeptidyl aminopeptidase-like C-terminal domain-containing protein n=1 Tax=Bionectria ochroleuca TaxID=29856 RepID=A0ABY6TV22_BIOOC|nr:unnamed protein product [Clonostachys rosea]
METIQGGQYLQGTIGGDKDYEILASILEGSNDSLRANGFLSVLCAGAGSDSMFAHISTAPVARDMLEIVDRIDEQKRKSCDKKSSDVSKLQYLGVSYGTLLGNTFASMFPGRVSRMLLDSLIDADDYIQDGTSITPVDAETYSDKSAGGIRKKIDNLIQNLEQNPAVEVHNRRIQLVISHIAKDAIRQMMYQPIVQYGLALKVLALAVASSYSVLLDTAAGNANTVSQTDMCVQAGASLPLSEFSAANEAGIAVFYGDSCQNPELHNATWAENTAKHFSEQSVITEESWSHVALSCSGWKFNPKYPYRGPFGYLGPKKDEKNAPDALVLFLSNHYDHATPLFNAYRMSQQHSGSTVAIQEAAGHCTLLTSTSKCIKDIGSRYFATDVVPANKTICQPDCQPGIPYKECPGFVAF